jgi:hypothetical protein
VPVRHCPARPFLIVTALKAFLRQIILVCTLVNFSMLRLCLVSALRRSGAASERNSSLTLSMQLVELCKASGRCGSGGDCDGLQDYLPVAPLAFKHGKGDTRRRCARL